jgi:hypothetical protein
MPLNSDGVDETEADLDKMVAPTDEHAEYDVTQDPDVDFGGDDQ